MQDAAATPFDAIYETDEHTALPLRDDTMLGVCQALGEDLGFNPNWLRMALGAGVLWNPVAMFAIYAGLGVIVLMSRLVFPNRLRSVAAQPELVADTAAAAVASDELPLAA